MDSLERPRRPGWDFERLWLAVAAGAALLGVVLFLILVFRQIFGSE